MNDKALRAAFRFLKAAAFHDIRLPAITLRRRNLGDAWGYYYNDPHLIEIHAGISSSTMILKVLAHEMVHAALETNATTDHHEHDAHFRQLHKLVCERMGWPPRGL